MSVSNLPRGLESQLPGFLVENGNEVFERQDMNEWPYIFLEKKALDYIIDEKSRIDIILPIAQLLGDTFS